MKKTRIAFFGEILIEDFDGATRTMFQLIKRIDPARFEFLFICGSGPDILAGFDCIKVPSFTLPVNQTYSMAMPIFAEARLRRRLADFAPEVIHIATPSLLGNFALKYARKAGLPVITIYHTNFASYIDYYFKHMPFLVAPAKALLGQIERAFYNGCDAVYVPSETMMQDLIATGIEASRMTLWRRGIDRSLFHPQQRDTRAMARLTGNLHPTVLFASRLVWEKNLETLFEVFLQLKDRNPEINLVVAGDGIAAKACREKMRGAVFMGKVGHDTLATLYASADMFLFPSVSETYGNVVAEAMASGLPCVVADGGGSRDFVTDGVNGFRCAPNNAAAYVEKLCLLAADPALRQRFSSAALTYIRPFDWDQLATSYFSDLERLGARYVLAV